MTTDVWMVNKSLKRKLLAMYCLLFVLPVGGLLYLMGDLIARTPAGERNPILLGLEILGPAALLLSLGAVALLYRSIGAIASMARQAEAFLHQAEQSDRKPPGDADEAGQISGYVSAMMAELRQARNDVDWYTQELHAANLKLADLASHDNLTGLFNRKQIVRLLDRELTRARAFGHPLAVMLLNVDGFKAFNDAHGLLRGDQALKAIAGMVASTVRCVDLAARYDGGEFMVVLPELGAPEARALAERLVAAVAAYPFGAGDGTAPARLTASLGVSVFAGDPGLSPQDLIALADARLFDAKKAGGNRVCL